MIQNLLSIRGLFALMIFLHHVDLFRAGGDFAVAFFFMLSGFLLARRYTDDLDRGRFDYGRFAARRLAYIFPVHIVCLALFAIFLQTDFTVVRLRHMAINFVLLQSWFDKPYIYFSGNPGSWFLSDILFCYLLFPLLCRLSRRRWTPLVLPALYLAAIHLIPVHMRFWAVYISPCTRWIDFALGIALAAALRGRRDGSRLSAQRATLTEMIPVALSAIAVIYCQEVDYLYVMASYWWLPVAATIAVYAINDNGRGLVTRLLHNRLLLSFGSVSFYFFMTHHLVIGIFDRYFAAPAGAVGQCLRVSVIFAITLALSTALKRLFRR